MVHQIGTYGVVTSRHDLNMHVVVYHDMMISSNWLQYNVKNDACYYL